jgi:hypothetical protein
VNKVRIWLIRKRFRRHTIAVIAYLRIAATLRELRARARVRRLFGVATLLCNAPRLSLRRARQLVRRRAAVTVQAYARRQLVLARQHKRLWATFLLQRLARGRLARVATRAPLAALRAAAAATAAAATAEEESVRKAAKQAEIVRVRAMANAAVAGRAAAPPSARFADASRYASRHRSVLPALPPPPAADASDAERAAYRAALDAHEAAAAGGGALGGGALVPAAALAACESRVSKLEEQVGALLGALDEQRTRIRALEERISAPAGAAQAGAMLASDLEKHTRAVVERILKERAPEPAPAAGGGLGGGQTSVTRRTSAGGAQQGRPSTSGQWSAGLLDLLGMAPARASHQPDADAGGGGGALAASAPRATMPAMAGARTGAIPPPSDALSGLQAAARAIELHFVHATDAYDGGGAAAALGDDKQNKEIAVLVRGQLCTALSRVMLHGFKSFKLIGRWHIWDFVQAAADAVRSPDRRRGRPRARAERAGG